MCKLLTRTHELEESSCLGYPLLTFAVFSAVAYEPHQITLERKNRGKMY